MPQKHKRNSNTNSLNLALQEMYTVVNDLRYINIVLCSLILKSFCHIAIDLWL